MRKTSLTSKMFCFLWSLVSSFDSTISLLIAKESKKAQEKSHIEADIEHEQVQVGLLVFPMAILLSEYQVQKLT